MALVRAEGAEVIDLGIVPDQVDATVAAIRKARAEASADVLLTSGGASVGDYDLVQKGLAAEGLALSFWRVALRPGRPMMHGRLGDMQVLGLPGNPVSAFVCAVLFLVPLIRPLGRPRRRRTADANRRCSAATCPPTTSAPTTCAPRLSAGPDGTLVATPLPVQDSSMMAALANADCLVVREPFAPAVKAGSALCDP